nr:hypothetical protein [Tanacetum cinerariifolium]
MEESIRRDLKFNDAEGTACLPNDTIFEELARMSDEESIQLNELMIFYTNLQQQVLDLEEAKIAQAKEISKLRKIVKKLEKRKKSRPAGLRILKKVGSSKQVESSEEKDSLGAQEDASKHEKSVEYIDQDAEAALVDESQRRMHDKDMFRVDDLEGNEVIVDVREKFFKKEVSTTDPVTTARKVVTAASVKDSAAPTTTTTADVDDELTLAKTLIVIKVAKPKVISTAITTRRAKDPSGYGWIIEQVPKLTALYHHKKVTVGRSTMFLRTQAAHSKTTNQIIESVHWKCFGENVIQLVIGLDKVQLNRTLFYMLLDEMVSDRYMFHSEVLNWVAGYGYG